VVEVFEKQWYVYGDNWGRGTEILYQAMGLKMPEKVKKAAEKDGYYAISLEVLSDYAGDYVVVSSDHKDDSFLESDIYPNIPTAKDNHILNVELNRFYFNDATTLAYQLDYFEDYFLGDK